MSNQRAAHSQETELSQQRQATNGASRGQTARPAGHPILRLQRHIGNRAVTRLIQAKLKVSAADDAFEHQAEHMADTVTRMPDSSVPQAEAKTDTVPIPPLVTGQTSLPVQRQSEEQGDAVTDLPAQINAGDPETERVRQLEEEYNNAVSTGSWAVAAEKLNAFNKDDLLAKLRNLDAQQVAALHQGALDNPAVGPQSQVALLTTSPEQQQANPGADSSPADAVPEPEASPPAESEDVATPGEAESEEQPIPSGSDKDELKKFAAIAKHIAQQVRVYALIKQGLAIPADLQSDKEYSSIRKILFRNACQWIDRKQAELVVLTPIHDSDRLPGLVGYFDPLIKYPDTGGDYPVISASGAYKDKLTSPHITYAEPEKLGGMNKDGRRLDILMPYARTDEELKDILIHEVQHDADQSEENEPWKVTGGEDFNNYQSEFRARWVASTGSPNKDFGSSADPAINFRAVTYIDEKSGIPYAAFTEFKNAQQESVFWDIVDNGYDYVPRLYTTDPNFKSMVDNFDKSISGNIADSVRIQAVSDALSRCDQLKLRNSPEVKAVFTAVSSLDNYDRNVLRGEEFSKPFWKQAQERLSAPIYDEFRAAITS